MQLIVAAAAACRLFRRGPRHCVETAWWVGRTTEAAWVADRERIDLFQRTRKAAHESHDRMTRRTAFVAYCIPIPLRLSASCGSGWCMFRFPVLSSAITGVSTDPAATSLKLAEPYKISNITLHSARSLTWVSWPVIVDSGSIYVLCILDSMVPATDILPAGPGGQR